jgi:hypothetical protein
MLVPQKHTYNAAHQRAAAMMVTNASSTGTHRFPTHHKLTGGIYDFLCPHGICYGYTSIKEHEGCVDAISGIFCYMTHPPEVFIQVSQRSV